MLVHPVSLLAVVGLLLLLQACASAPTGDHPAAAPKQGPVPELRLNLPDQTVAVCASDNNTGVDRTFLDKGISAMVANDHVEAVNYFRRYQRLESSPGVDWEASIAVAYDKMLPQSPYYNWRAATESYRRLMRNPPEGVVLHPQILMMRDMLAILVDLHLRIDTVEKEKDVLSENLEKREEALKRLRELTLGQKGAAQ